MLSKINTPVKYAETVEIIISNVNTREHKFTDNNSILIGKKIKGIFFSSDAVSKTFKSNPIIPNTIARKCYLQLFNDKGVKAIEIPVDSLLSNVSEYFPLEDVVLDFTKSVIVVSDPTGIVIGMAFQITFIWDY